MSEILKRSVGFDIDDCLAFSSPAFDRASKLATARGSKPFADSQFWADVNKESTKPGGMEWKTEVTDILKQHQVNGDTVHLITARPPGSPEASKQFTNFMSVKLGVPTENIAFTSEGSKVAELQKRGINTFYGDSDSDISAAIAAGAEGIRVQRGTDSTYKDKYHPGMFGEHIIEGTTGHSPSLDGATTQVKEKENSSIYDEAKSLVAANKELAAGLNGQIDNTTPWQSKPVADVNNLIDKKKETPISLDESRPKLDYVTAAQGRIFINGILLDECYDIQYSYKEAKEPIYGYLSKHWDKVLNGTVIIYGTFTINYKHDMYLYAILDQLKNSTLKEQIKNISDTKDLQDSFAKKLRAYRKEQIEQKDLKLALRKAQADLKVAEANNNAKQEEYRLSKLDLATKLNNTKKEKDKFWNSLTPSYQKELTEKVNNLRFEIGGQDSDLIGPVNPVDSFSLDSINKQSSAEQNAKLEELSAKQKIVSEAQTKLAKSNETLANLNSLLKATNAGTQQAKYASIVSAIQKTEAEIDQQKLDLTEAQTDAEKKRAELKELNDIFNKEIADKNVRIKGILDSDPNIAKAEQFEMQIKRLENAIKTSENSEVDGSELNRANKKVEILTKQVKEKDATLSGLQNDLQGIKENMTREADLLTNVGNEFDEDAEDRAEDFHGFNIMIEYNGNIHMILKNCELIGHSHAIMQSGEPVKEMYQFIAQKL